MSVLGLRRACLLLLQKGVEVPRVRYETVHVQSDRPERTPRWPSAIIIDANITLSLKWLLIKKCHIKIKKLIKKTTHRQILNLESMKSCRNKISGPIHSISESKPRLIIFSKIFYTANNYRFTYMKLLYSNIVNLDVFGCRAFFSVDTD